MSSILIRKDYLYKKLVNCGTALMTLRFAKSTTVSDTSNEYQYIQVSKVPTFHFQQSLPHLPIPKLEDTCQRYLNAQKPLLSEQQLNNTTSCVSKFLKEDGIKLQKELTQKDARNPQTSYISDLWFDMYLSSRRALPINYNPILIFVPESNSQYNTQLVKATNLIISSMRFMKSLRKGILEPEVYHLNPKKSDNDLFRTVTKLLPSRISWYGAYLFKAYPLDMSQYSNLFNTTRIPEVGKDRIYHNPTERHIVAMRNGHFYAFNVLDENDNVLPPSEIASCLKTILEDNTPVNECPIGILTTSDRDQWALTRTHLKELGNQTILEKIDSAVFTLNLDDDIIETDYNKLIKTYLHSDGTNRWFDKSFSLIVTKDGYGGINFEHSWGDGVAVLRYFKDIKEDISKNPKFHPDDVHNLHTNVSAVQKLHFTVNTKIQETVNHQRNLYNNWTNSLCVDHVIYEGFGKDECKKFKVSPDAIMQLAFQLALYNLEGCMVPTYESCSTAAFKHGRTETIRSCTMKTKAFCAAIAEKGHDTSVSQLKEMIINCSNAHNTLTKEAAMGQGFDRHLFALRKIWEQTNTNKPAIFNDPAYDALNHNILSTSTLSSPAVFAGGFGPVEQDGYGIGYMIQDKRLGAVVTSYNNRRNAYDYVKSLDHAIKEIHKVLLHV